jgi:hypothetical protein
MKCRPSVSALVLAAVCSTTACVDTTKVGLSNVRANESRNDRMDKPHDVIANGNDSCEVPGRARQDPIPVRFNACPGNDATPHRVAARD